MTNSLQHRVVQHKSGQFEGFTSQYNATRLVYYESYDDVYKAINREKQLKGWRREKKLRLIETMNAKYRDLSADWGKPISPPKPSLRSVKTKKPDQTNKANQADKRD